ncbi:hypothetical protein [uncultured Sneathiella sp.]|uniref:hypothetical protein n=1 Tax=uncultured Sneathiella sp. TaxID=879315 RepID=UPI0025963069|nr:hypothetical protein [uncultured Sneathiella sp.]
MGILLNSKKVFLFLIAIAILLVTLSLYVNIQAYGYNRWHPTLVDLLSVDSESNISSYFSTIVLLLASFVLFSIGLIRRAEKNKDFKYWLGLAFIFLYLSVDENISIHEKIIKVYWWFFTPSDFDNFVWLIPYGGFVLALAIIYWKFIFSLPTRTWLFFGLSGILFVGGALGMEVIGGLYIGTSWYQPIDWNKHADGTYYIISAIEESCEMLGVIIFLYALLAYAERTWGGLYIFAGKQPASPGEH